MLYWILPDHSSLKSYINLPCKMLTISPIHSSIESYINLPCKTPTLYHISNLSIFIVLLSKAKFC